MPANPSNSTSTVPELTTGKGFAFICCLPPTTSLCTQGTRHPKPNSPNPASYTSILPWTLSESAPQDRNCLSSMADRFSVVLVCSITSLRNATSTTSSPDCQLTPAVHCTYKLHMHMYTQTRKLWPETGANPRSSLWTYSPQRNFLFLQDAVHRLLFNQVVLSPLRKHHPTSAYRLLPLVAIQADCIFHHPTGITHISLYPISVPSSPSG